MGDDQRSDEELMALYQCGDMGAFQILYLRYERRIYHYFLMSLGNPEQSAEFFQETFLKLHRYRNRYDPQLSFRAWLFTIASNLARNEFKRMARQRKVFNREEVNYEMIADTSAETPENAMERQELSHQLQEALYTLPARQREAILLSTYQGFSYSEIAEITGSSVGAVKQKIHRGITALRKKLKK